MAEEKLFLPVPIPISVPILLAIPVFAILAIFAIAIVVAILALIHVYAVDEGAERGQLFVLLQVVDKGIIVFVGEVGTADVNADVGHAGYEAGVCDNADGGAVQDDIVEMLTQQGEGLVQRLAGYQFRRIGWNSSTGQDVEVGRNGNRLAKRQ